MQQFPSQLLEKAVEEFSKLPGVGRKTALRFVLHLLRKTKVLFIISFSYLSWKRQIALRYPKVTR